MSSEEMDNGEQAVGACSGRVERQCLLHQSLGTLDFFIGEFRPSGNRRVEIGPAEGRIAGSVIRVEVDRALEHLLRLVIVVARRVREELTTAQDVFVGGEARGGFGEGAVPLETRKLYCCRADDAAGDVVLHAEDILDLAVICFGPDLPAGRGLNQLGADANAIAGAPNAALEQVARVENAPDLRRGEGAALELKAR